MIVIDSSAVAALLLREEGAAAILRAVEVQESLVAPALLPYEVTSALHAAVRRKRISQDAVPRCIAHFLRFPWALDIQSSEVRVQEISRLAARHDLTPYDAAYLELAMRQGTAIISLDAELRAAAKAEMIEVYPKTLKG